MTQQTQEAMHMNNTVFFDSNVSDDIRRQQLYDGQLFVYGMRPSVLLPTSRGR
jgi:hypothetical protein